MSGERPFLTLGIIAGVVVLVAVGLTVVYGNPAVAVKDTGTLMMAAGGLIVLMGGGYVLWKMARGDDFD